MRLIKQRIVVKIVNGRAFFINIFKPKLKLFLSNSKIREILCLTECRKQKYSVNAKSGEK